MDVPVATPFIPGANKTIAKAELAKIPARNELQANLVGILVNPLSGLVNTLNGNIRKLVYALKAIADKKNI